MELSRTERFKRAYKRLTPGLQSQAGVALGRLAQDLSYPSLQVKRIKGTAGIWEARVTRSCRLTFEMDGNELVLRNIGEHDATLKNP